MYNSKIFSLIDIKQAYHGIRLEESSRQYTCFTTFKGNYEFNSCVFGMLNSQAALRRTMSKVLAGVLGKNIYIYIDDLIIHSTTVEHHLDLLKEVIERLDKANLSVNPAKCKMFQTGIKYLGMFVDQLGVHCVEEQIDSILNLKRPENTKSVRQFLGAVNFYSSHIPYYSELAKPLYALCSKTKVFEWNENHEKAWVSLKGKLVNWETGVPRL